MVIFSLQTFEGKKLCILKNELNQKKNPNSSHYIGIGPLKLTRNTSWQASCEDLYLSFWIDGDNQGTKKMA